MAHQTSPNQPLPLRVPGTAHDASTPADAPTISLLRCPSCHAEVTSVVEHAIASDRQSSRPVEWTSEASMLSATLQGLKALTVAPASATVGAPAAAEEPTESRPRPHLRVVPRADAADEMPLAADATVSSGQDVSLTGDLTLVEAPAEQAGLPAEADTYPETGLVAEADTGSGTAREVEPAATRRRRQGFLSRVLTVRSFRGERDIARASRAHDVAVAGLLDAAPGLLSLHHRGLPGRRAEVSHLAVGPAGVMVVHTRLLGDAASAATVRAQVGAVRSVLAGVDLEAVRVEGLLCVRTRDAADTESGNWGDVRLVVVRDLAAALGEEGPLTAEHRQTLHELLATELPARG
ncbi:hypothetical protein RKE38_01170 [Phycicoccus sp. M110.8]|uniref:hypothetical protein n=1 Tax=Phycicoccus sp. M110.8 TaxID=3075433 RepID=UPI0028FD4235|nr:hypothetical protein [Phycicoccus sp. M110.8]MDU0312279.1 hypothetical protein [Phycicoccus sp. M110.8]